jgi:chromosome segregation ATPase
MLQMAQYSTQTMGRIVNIQKQHANRISSMENQIQTMQLQGSQLFDAKLQLGTANVQLEHEKKANELLRIAAADKETTCKQNMKLTLEIEQLRTEKEKYHAVEAKKEILLSENTKLTIENKEFRANADGLKRQCEQQRDDEYKRYRAMKDERDDFHKKYTEFEKSHGDLATKHGDLGGKHNDLEEKHGGLLQQHSDLEKKHGGLQQQHSDLETMHNVLFKADEAKNVTIQDITAQLKKVSSQFEQYKKERRPEDRVQEELKNAKTNLATVTKERDQHLKDKNAAVNSNTFNQKRISTFEGRERDFDYIQGNAEQKIKELNFKLRDADSKIKTLENENADLKTNKEKQDVTIRCNEEKFQRLEKERSKK